MVEEYDEKTDVLLVRKLEPQSAKELSRTWAPATTTFSCCCGTLERPSERQTRFVVPGCASRPQLVRTAVRSVTCAVDEAVQCRTSLMLVVVMLAGGGVGL